MKALCHPYWSWLKGFNSVQIGWLSPRFLITIPSHLLLWGLLGLKHFVSLRIVSLGYGFIHVVDVCAVGYDGRLCQRACLRLIATSRLCFISTFLG
jgi:hypothetical protein